jgi:hypothetical protein
MIPGRPWRLWRPWRPWRPWVTDEPGDALLCVGPSAVGEGDA